MTQESTSTNIKILLIIILGIGATLASSFSNRYLLRIDAQNQAILLNVLGTKTAIGHIRSSSREFIRTADTAIWDDIKQNVASLQAELGQAILQGDGAWIKAMSGIERLTDQYFSILTQMHAPVITLNREKEALQQLGLSFSQEAEKQIILPYKQEEGLNIYQGRSIDPFKTKIKDTAHELVALHIKQQLILNQLLLTADLDRYHKERETFLSDLQSNKARLDYMSLLIGQDPHFQKTLRSLKDKLTALMAHEKHIVTAFSKTIELTRNLADTGQRLEELADRVSGEITVEAQRSRRFHQKASWWFLVVIIALLSALGSLLGRDVIRFVRDLRQSRIRIKESEKNLSITLQSIGDAVIVTDARGAVTNMNPPAEQLTGWSRDSAIGRELSTVFHIVNGQTRQTAESPVQKVIAEGRIVGLANDTILISKNGEEYQIADSGAPIREGDGEISGVVMVFRDVTEKYLAAQKIEQSERFLNNFTANLPGVAYCFRVTENNTYQIDFITKKVQEVFGLVIEKGMGIDGFIDHVPEEDREAFILSITEAINNFTSWNHEGRFIKPSGEMIWYSGHSVPFRDKDRDEIVFYGVLMDITRRKLTEKENQKLEAALQQSHKMEAIGTLAGGIAHDFNNMLGAIIGYAELGLKRAKEDDRQKRNFQNIFDAGTRAAKLVRQILTFSRKTEHELLSVNVHEVLEEVLEMLRSSMPSSISINRHISENTGNILADPIQLQQIIMNLCTNAIHAMENQKGQLDIRLSRHEIRPLEASGYPGLRSGIYVRLTIQDNGSGISPENLAKIFDPYFTTKDKGKGTGLGLSVVHGIVKEYGGAIYPYSEPGKGTTFNVYLPSTDNETAFKEKLKTSLPRGCETILLVDDEPSLVSMGAQMLKNLGYTLIESSDGKKALDLFCKNPDGIDLVITDMTMPEMTGDELAQRILQIRPATPIILYTGYNQNLSEQRVLEIGIRALVMKPMVMSDFAHLIRSILDQPQPESPPV